MRVLAWRNLFDYLRDRRGSAAVEFALIAPVVLLMILGMIQGALVLRTQSILDEIVFDATRGIAAGYLDKTQAETFVKTQSLARIGITAFVNVDPPTEGDPTDPDAVVSIGLTHADLKAKLPFSLFVPSSLTANLTMRSYTAL